MFTVINLNFDIDGPPLSERNSEGAFCGSSTSSDERQIRNPSSMQDWSRFAWASASSQSGQKVQHWIFKTGTSFKIKWNAIFFHKLLVSLF